MSEARDDVTGGLGGPSDAELDFGLDENIDVSQVPPLERWRWYDSSHHHIRVDFADGMRTTIAASDTSNPIYVLGRQGDSSRLLTPLPWPPEEQDLDELKVIALELLTEWRRARVRAPLRYHTWHFRISRDIGEDFRIAGMDAAREAKIRPGYPWGVHWATWHGELVELVADDIIAIDRALAQREDETRVHAYNYRVRIERARELDQVDAIIAELTRHMESEADELERLGQPVGEQGRQ